VICLRHKGDVVGCVRVGEVTVKNHLLSVYYVSYSRGGFRVVLSCCVVCRETGRCLRARGIVCVGGRATSWQLWRAWWDLPPG